MSLLKPRVHVELEVPIVGICSPNSPGQTFLGKRRYFSGIVA